ncbi:MAG: glutathione S-transferase family protein [Parvibaculales bacterium]
MIVYSAPNMPNPRIVEMLILEKQLKIDIHYLDALGGENRKPEFLAKNPLGQLPALETDDGDIITEVSAIAEYFEELKPDPVLVGSTSVERAQARMWARRVDLMILSPMTMGFQNSIAKKFFEGRIKLYPEIGDSMIEKANDGLANLDGLMAGKPFLCGDRMSYGDIMLFCYLDFYRKVGQRVDPGLVHLTEFFNTMLERDSAKATAP